MRRVDQQAAGPARQPGSQRGASLSVFVLVVFAALILVAGLVIDGGQKVTATRRAESIAAAAARAGADAGATEAIAGRPAGARAQAAAQAYLRGTLDVSGTVRIRGRSVGVSTEVRQRTIFLSVLGITWVTGHGESVQDVRSGP